MKIYGKGYNKVIQIKVLSEENGNGRVYMYILEV